jgi:hypothetical protein
MGRGKMCGVLAWRAIKFYSRIAGIAAAWHASKNTESPDGGKSMARAMRWKPGLYQALAAGGAASAKPRGFHPIPVRNSLLHGYLVCEYVALRMLCLLFPIP